MTQTDHLMRGIIGYTRDIKDLEGIREWDEMRETLRLGAIETRKVEREQKRHILAQLTAGWFKV